MDQVSVTDSDRLDFLERVCLADSVVPRTGASLTFEPTARFRGHVFPPQFHCVIGKETFGSGNEESGLRAAIDRAMQLAEEPSLKITPVSPRGMEGLCLRTIAAAVEAPGVWVIATTPQRTTAAGMLLASMIRTDCVNLGINIEIQNTSNGNLRVRNVTKGDQAA